MFRTRRWMITKAMRSSLCKRAAKTFSSHGTITRRKCIIDGADNHDNHDNLDSGCGGKSEFIRKCSPDGQETYQLRQPLTFQICERRSRSRSCFLLVISAYFKEIILSRFPIQKVTMIRRFDSDFKKVYKKHLNSG